MKARCDPAFSILLEGFETYSAFFTFVFESWVKSQNVIVLLFRHEFVDRFFCDGYDFTNGLLGNLLLLLLRLYVFINLGDDHIVVIVVAAAS